MNQPVEPVVLIEQMIRELEQLRTQERDKARRASYAAAIKRLEKLACQLSEAAASQGFGAVAALVAARFKTPQSGIAVARRQRRRS